MSRRITRRTFIQSIAYGGAMLSLPHSRLIRAPSANAKLQIVFIGTGGRGDAHVGEMARMGEQCIAFADVDKRQWIKPLEKWPHAAAYSDWRELFENHEKQIDVVFVATPDHSHFAPSMTAVSLGKHCYTEKPLTWSVREAQLLTKAYEANPDVVTQMGNQGHAMMGWRRAHAYIESGVLGDIVEFHTWTDRPIWPQGYGRPTSRETVPDSLNWDAWLGPASQRPYTGHWQSGPFAQTHWKQTVYHRFGWRGFLDFGAGALGDMACHTTDGIHTIMQPGYPTSIEPLEQSGDLTDQFALGSKIKWEFAANEKRRGFTLYWYEGYRSFSENPEFPFKDPYMPDTPQEMIADGRELPRTGNLIIGTQGKMLVQGDYWDSPRLIGESFAREVGRIDPILEPSPGHHTEFIMACRGEKPRSYAQSNWGYAGPMTEKILLGNVAVKLGRKIEINSDGSIADPAAKELLWREPRKGWGPMESIVK